MSCNTSKSHCSMRKRFGSNSTCTLSKIWIKQLQTYTDHYGVTWFGKKRDFVNVPMYSYESLRSIGHIMVDKPRELSTGNTTIEFTTNELLWSTLYKKSTTRKMPICEGKTPS